MAAQYHLSEELYVFALFWRPFHAAKGQFNAVWVHKKWISKQLGRYTRHQNKRLQLIILDAMPPSCKRSLIVEALKLNFFIKRDLIYDFLYSADWSLCFWTFWFMMGRAFTMRDRSRLQAGPSASPCHDLRSHNVVKCEEYGLVVTLKLCKLVIANRKYDLMWKDINFGKTAIYRNKFFSASIIFHIGHIFAKVQRKHCVHIYRSHDTLILRS